jgi:hypothetical protein
VVLDLLADLLKSLADGFQGLADVLGRHGEAGDLGDADAARAEQHDGLTGQGDPV